ncbi:MAG: hypothetical protein E7399_02220 [Ruminococcaceae bacterium]|nr:hypothetical protein [Oscillospiraceae bacterium]
MKYFDITDFGAIGDGKTNNTKSIQAAIDECSKTGGTVLIQSGIFMSESITLKSNVRTTTESISIPADM